MTIRTMTLAGRDFAVPALPLRVNRTVYPLCRELSNSDLLARCAAAGGALDCTDAEMGQLADVAYSAASAAEPDLTRAAFDDLPIAPPELLDAFFVVRYQTGAWLERSAEGDAMPGEATGA